jgi:hypothetical protein
VPGNEEQLRLVATLIDQISGPMNRIERSVKDFSRGESVAGLSKQFHGLQQVSEKAAGTLNTAFAPAMSSFGLASLSASAALGAVAFGVDKYAKSMVTMRYASAESGFATDRIFQMTKAAEELGQEDPIPWAKAFGDKMSSIKNTFEDLPDFARHKIKPMWDQFRADLNNPELDRATAMDRAMIRVRDGIQNLIETGHPDVANQFAKMFGGKPALETIELINKTLQLKEQGVHLSEREIEIGRRYAASLKGIGDQWHELIVTVAPFITKTLELLNATPRKTFQDLGLIPPDVKPGNEPPEPKTNPLVDAVKKWAKENIHITPESPADKAIQAINAANEAIGPPTRAIDEAASNTLQGWWSTLTEKSQAGGVPWQPPSEFPPMVTDADNPLSQQLGIKQIPDFVLDGLKQKEPEAENAGRSFGEAFLKGLGRIFTLPDYIAQDQAKFYADRERQERERAEAEKKAAPVQPWAPSTKYKPIAFTEQPQDLSRPILNADGSIRYEDKPTLPGTVSAGGYTGTWQPGGPQPAKPQGDGVWSNLNAPRTGRDEPTSQFSTARFSPVTEASAMLERVLLTNYQLDEQRRQQTAGRSPGTAQLDRRIDPRDYDSGPVGFDAAALARSIKESTSAAKIEGGATLDVNVSAPEGTRVNGSTRGVFNQFKISRRWPRAKQMPIAADTEAEAQDY